MLRIDLTAPPAHAIDDPPYWIWTRDAWDIDRIVAEIEALGADGDAHPFRIYYSGSTRYSLTAKLTVPEAIRGDGPATVTVEHYLRKGETPTRFELRAVEGRDWAIAETAIPKMGYYEFARRGLVRVCDVPGEDGQPTTLRAQRADDGGIPDAWLAAISRANKDLIDDLGHAIYRLSKNEVAVAEGKP
jgi:hypothetical protein